MADNNVKNIGFHIFDPVLNFVSSYIQQNNILYILNYALELSKITKTKRIESYDKHLDIAQEHKKRENISDENLKKIKEEIKEEIKELLNVINDLYKNEIILYNLIYGISEFIKQKKLEYFIIDKDYIIEYLIDPYIDLYKDLNFINKFKLIDFKKISYQEYKINDLEDSSFDELENISIDLSNEIEILHKNILYLIELIEQFKNKEPQLEIINIVDLNTTFERPELNTPFERPEINLEVIRESTQKGGNKIDEVIQLLNKLKNNIEGVSSLTVEKEIPGGINLELDVIKKILSDFKINLELQAKPGDDIDDLKYTKKWDYNLFEEIPDYKSIKYDTSKKFVTNPLNPKIPQESDKILDSEDLIKIINDKEEYIDQKINDISDIVGDIIMFTKKLQIYRIKEMEKVSKYNYTFTNIGEKSDLQGRIVELNTMLEQNKIELENKKKLKEYLDDPNFTEYLIKKDTLVNRPPTNEEGDFKDLKDLMTQTVEPLNEDGTIKNKVKIAMDHMMKVRPVNGYKKGFFLDENSYKNYETVKNYLEAFRNKVDETKELQKSEILRLRTDGNVDISIFVNLINKYQKSKLPSRNEKYNIVILKLDDMIKKYNRNDELKDLIEKIENDNPLYLENYTIYKLDDGFDMTKIKESIENKKLSIDKIILSIDEEIKSIEKELSNITPLLKDFKENTDYDKMININNSLFRTKIELLHNKLLQINKTVKIIFNLKDGVDDINKLNIIENNIVHSQNNITANWFKNQKGGTNYIFNIENINKINDINSAMRKLLIKTEKYKLISTDLLENYALFIKNIHSVIVYIYYRLTVLQDVQNKNFRITRKFNNNTLEQLKRNISLIKRKNFDLIKEYYMAIINNMIDTQNMLKNSNKEYKFVKYDNMIKDNNGLLNLFVLAHIESFYDKY
jgi:hypothetical protein